MKKYLSLLYVPWFIELLNYVASRFFMPELDWLNNLVGWSLAGYIGFQAVRKFEASLLMAGLLGMTLVMLDFLLGVLLIPFTEIPEGWTADMLFHSFIGYVFASLMFAFISGCVAGAGGWVGRKLKNHQ